MNENYMVIGIPVTASNTDPFLQIWDFRSVQNGFKNAPFSYNAHPLNEVVIYILINTF